MKAKFFTLLPFLIIVVKFVAGQTYVSGLINSNTTWLPAGNPYIVTSDVLVDEGAILTIEPGTIIKFDSAASLLVRGSLHAVGTLDGGEILFTSNAASPKEGDWSYIMFDNESVSWDSISQTGCIMQYCTIEYSGKALYSFLSGAVLIYGSEPLIDHCEIRNNLSCGVEVYNYSPLNTVRIRNNFIHDNDVNPIIGGNPQGAIVIDDETYTGNYFIEDNLIQSNNLNGYISFNYSGILVVSSGAVYCSGNHVAGNSFSEQSSGGSALKVYSVSGSVDHNIVCSNTCGVALGSAGCSFPVEFHNNVIANNICGYAVSLCLCGTFSNNEIVFNTCSSYETIHADMENDFKQNTCAYNKTSYPATSYTIVGYYPDYFPLQNNNIFGNETEGDSLFSFTYASPPYAPNFNASPNWWGSNDTDVVNDLIFDYFDNFVYGVVDVLPFLNGPDISAPISPPTGFTKTDLGGGTVKLTWQPNPEGDVAGYKIYWGEMNCYTYANEQDAGNTLSITLSNADYNDVFAITAYDNSIDGVNDQTDGNESWFALDQNQIPVNIASPDSYSSSILVFPNPATTYFDFELKGFENAQPIMVSLTTLQGKIAVPTEMINTINFRMLTQNLSSGIYFLRVSSGKKTQVQKIVVE